VNVSKKKIFFKYRFLFFSSPGNCFLRASRESYWHGTFRKREVRTNGNAIHRYGPIRYVVVLLSWPADKRTDTRVWSSTNHVRCGARLVFVFLDFSGIILINGLLYTHTYIKWWITTTIRSLKSFSDKSVFVFELSRLYVCFNVQTVILFKDFERFKNFLDQSDLFLKYIFFSNERKSNIYANYIRSRINHLVIAIILVGKTWKIYRTTRIIHLSLTWSLSMYPRWNR